MKFVRELLVDSNQGGGFPREIPIGNHIFYQEETKKYYIFMMKLLLLIKKNIPNKDGLFVQKVVQSRIFYMR